MDNKPIVQTTQGIKNTWSSLSGLYKGMDSATQTFYFSLINILRLHEAHNILEVGCGRCTLLPFSLQLKNPDANYLATDLTPDMIQLAHQFLQKNLQQYESKLTYEEWLQKNKTVVKAANGEQPFNFGKKFDRIICNLVLMIAQDPLKMLTNLYNQAEQGCLLGVTVWGNKALNKFFGEVPKSAAQLGYQLPNVRSNYHLYQKVGQLGQQTGWQVVLSWEQNSSFPYISIQPIRQMGNFSISRMKTLDEEQKSKVLELYTKKMVKELEEKRGLTFPVEIYILRKKSKSQM